jgi:hypothetical protein
VRCRDCKYWDSPNDYDVLGICRNKHFVSRLYDDIPDTKIEMEGVVVSMETHVERSDIDLETGAFFGCLHFFPIEEQICKKK